MSVCLFLWVLFILAGCSKEMFWKYEVLFFKVYNFNILSLKKELEYHDNCKGKYVPLLIYTVWILQLVDKLAGEERLQEEKVGEHKMKKRIANLVPESESNIKRLKVCFD